MIRKAPSKTAPRKSKESASRSADRIAAEVDPAARAANLLQLRRAKGQIEGIERMLEQDRYCVDIIVQITAARASLQVVANSLLESHLKACHHAAIATGGHAADEMYQELVHIVSKMAR